MKITIALVTLLNTFATVPALCGDVFLAAEDPVPDLCTENVYLNSEGLPLQDSDGTTLSRYCVWTGEDAPVWADEVCCEIGPDSAYCTPTDALGGCSAAQLMRWCDHAKFDGEQVVCLQSFPSACTSGVCADPPLGVQADPLAAWTPLCCYGGTCYELSFEELCGGSFQWCDSPYTNEDGTVGCAD